MIWQAVRCPPVRIDQALWNLEQHFKLVLMACFILRSPPRRVWLGAGAVLHHTGFLPSPFQSGMRRWSLLSPRRSGSGIEWPTSHLWKSGWFPLERSQTSPYRRLNPLYELSNGTENTCAVTDSNGSTPLCWKAICLQQLDMEMNYQMFSHTCWSAFRKKQPPRHFPFSSTAPPSPRWHNKDICK